MSAWVKQHSSQVKKKGTDQASWYCEWEEPDGTRRCKSCGPGPKGKRLAERKRDKIKAQLLTGTYRRDPKLTWSEFVEAYRNRVLLGLAVKTMTEAMVSLRHFERIARPKRMTGISAETIAEFTAKRRPERGKKPGSTVSPATINKDLRHVKAALRVAHEWGYMQTVPKFKFSSSKFR